MGNIFISYRREDSAGHTGRLFDRLREHFGNDRVFMDIAGIEPGVDFVDAIDRAVGSCDAFVVVIGKQWLNVTDADGRRRLENPEDFIRLELATALRRNIRVIPVLVQGAAAPSSGSLPEDLRKLSRLQAHEVSDNRWDYDVGRLIETLEKVLKKEVTKDEKVEDDKVPAPPPPPPNFPRWVIAVIAVVLIAVGVYLFLPVGQPGIEMPNVVGEPFERAKAMLAEKGLEVSTEEKQTHEKPPGTVIDQKPNPGTEVKKGQRVDLVLAIKVTIEMPDLLGKHIDEAKALLREAGLTAPNVKEVKTKEKPFGVVLVQNPKPGMKVQLNQKVYLEVAVRPSIEMANVVGQPSDKAKAILEEKGLVVSTTEKQVREKRPGTVLEQSPRAGVEVERGQRVDLVIASGPTAEEQRKLSAKKLAEAWYAAYIRKDIGMLVRIASLPFFFDNETLSRLEDIETRYRNVFSQRAAAAKDEDPGPWQLRDMKIQTLSEWKQGGYDLQRDRLLRSITLSDDDFMIRIVIEQGTRRAGIALYTRNVGGQIKMAGFWD